MEEMKLYTSSEAAQYVNHKKDRQWANPDSSFRYHVMKGNLHPVKIEGNEGKDRRIVLFTKEELDRFIAEQRFIRGKAPADLTAVEEDLGKQNDRALAQRAGVSLPTIRRRRRAQGTAAYRPPTSIGDNDE